MVTLFTRTAKAGGFFSPRFIRYAIVGVLNTLLFFGLVNLLGALFGVYSGLAFTAISAFSVSLVIVHSYLWNRRWVFRSEERKKTGQFVKFALVNFGAMAINAGIVYVITTYVPPFYWFAPFGGLAKIFWANFAEAVSIVAVVIWNYLGFKFFVFRSTASQNISAEGGDARRETALKKKSTIFFSVMLIILSLLVGLLHVGPLLAIATHLATQGQPFVFSYENYRNDLTYLTRAREVYDGHSPSSDPFSDQSPPTMRNPIPSVIFGAFLRVTGGKIFPAYIAVLFLFSQVNFILFYLVGKKLFYSNLWAVTFALIAVLTPISLRILNFYGTA